MDGPLDAEEATWLDEHLAGCPDCTAIAAAYESDRQALRATHDPMPVPPRDLWARTAAAIEQESAKRGHAAAPARRPASRVPLGALSGLAVIAVVVGLSAVSSGLFVFVDTPASGGTAGLATPPTATDAAVAEATPIAVGAGDVAYLVGNAGGVAISKVGVDEVCATEDSSDCGNLADASSHQVALSVAPKAIIRSPSDPASAIVVSPDSSGGSSITVFALPSESPAPTDSVASAAPSPTPTVAASAPASVQPSVTPTVAPSIEPSGAAPSASAAASAVPTVEPSTTPPPSVEPSVVPSVSPSDIPNPTETPAPTVAIQVAIASGVQVVGEGAAFSTDGQWFAFTAQPANGSGGPDIWVWRVGDQQGRQLTTDGNSVFASWDDDTIVGSHVGSDTAGGSDHRPTFTIDPATGAAQPVVTTAWRPVVDPTGRYAVVWVGDAAPNGDAASDGSLELQAWHQADGATVTPASQPIYDGPIADFDVRWDETGEWFGVWVADSTDATFGRLTLYHLDPATGKLEAVQGGPVETPALPGISVGDGRMAWATPEGQGGEGSRVQIAAWKDDAVGTIETVPAEGVVVVR
jgi:hypothetical protein